MLAQRPALERELADYKQGVAEAALLAFEGAGREGIADLDGKIRAVSFQLDAIDLAHALAQRLDAEAVAAWRSAVQANPKIAVEGISKTECCKRCGPDHGCIITGQACAHPIGVGSVGPALMANENVKAVFLAAVEKLGVRR